MLKAALFFVTMMTGAAAFADPCIYDRGEMLSKSYKAFDETLGGGWREAGDKDGCEATAADLIKDYRETIVERQLKALKHHEAQLAAAAGQSDRAIDLIKAVAEMETTPEMIHYREAELAFLQRDRAALRVARIKLADVPSPEGFAAGVARFKASYPDVPPPVWPPNLNVVDRFLNCYGYSYREAYNGCAKSESN